MEAIVNPPDGGDGVDGGDDPDVEHFPLHEAAKWGHVHCLRILLSEEGGYLPYINELDHQGLSPLHYACRHNEHIITQVLINAGADVLIGRSYSIANATEAAATSGQSSQSTPSSPPLPDTTGGSPPPLSSSPPPPLSSSPSPPLSSSPSPPLASPPPSSPLAATPSSSHSLHSPIPRRRTDSRGGSHSTPMSSIPMDLLPPGPGSKQLRSFLLPFVEKARKQRADVFVTEGSRSPPISPARSPAGSPPLSTTLPRSGAAGSGPALIAGIRTRTASTPSQRKPSSAPSSPRAQYHNMQRTQSSGDMSLRHARTLSGSDAGSPRECSSSDSGRETDDDYDHWGGAGAGAGAAAAAGGGDDRDNVTIAQGFLFKTGGKDRKKPGHWQKRFFILTRKTLSYFRNPRHTKAAGTIDASSIEEVTKADGLTRKERSFKIVTPERIYYLYSSSPVDYDDWMLHLDRLTAHNRVKRRLAAAAGGSSSGHRSHGSGSNSGSTSPTSTLRQNTGGGGSGGRPIKRGQSKKGVVSSDDDEDVDSDSVGGGDDIQIRVGFTNNTLSPDEKEERRKRRGTMYVFNPPPAERDDDDDTGGGTSASEYTSDADLDPSLFRKRENE
eukprot:TRINITY_DN1190_c0_g1_i1.p1 TRINITY_DN1190_c0_g1~~TRINITY_DN1190_c0_g1_i1.p1  ORF type:complete len:611 (+),score=156.29 TRINITY_DN1190_c0_g1_i1:172-2004(+)